MWKTVKSRHKIGSVFYFRKVASKCIRTHAWQNAECRTSPCSIPLTVPSFIKRYKLFHWWRPSCPLTTSAVPRPPAVADQQAFRTQSRNCDWPGMFGCANVITYKTHTMWYRQHAVLTLRKHKTMNKQPILYTRYLYTRMYVHDTGR